ncbi:hypothetical protein AAG570_001698 [Ranatra chinensis]|uniref:Uncharacterized protein n=1 Tax=Ranatra chinensis TaxID=642074 RepID=A0ABD0YRV8_9HEMI
MSGYWKGGGWRVDWGDSNRWRYNRCYKVDRSGVLAEFKRWRYMGQWDGIEDGERQKSGPRRASLHHHLLDHVQQPRNVPHLLMSAQPPRANLGKCHPPCSSYDVKAPPASCCRVIGDCLKFRMKPAKVTFYDERTITAPSSAVSGLIPVQVGQRAEDG